MLMEGVVIVIVIIAIIVLILISSENYQGGRSIGQGWRPMDIYQRSLNGCEAILRYGYTAY